MEPTLVLGVDTGSARTVAVLAEVAEGRPRVIGVGRVPCQGLRRGVVVDLEATAAAIEQAVKQACDQAGCQPVSRAVISISGGHIATVGGSASVPVHRPSHGVAPEDIRRALDSAAAVELAPGRKVIHVLPRAYRLDNADGVADPLGMAGRQLEAEVNLVTGDELPVENGLRAAMRAGLQVSDYLVGVRAAGQAVLTREERDAGVLLLDIGAGTTSVAVYDRGHLWHLAIIAVGGERITSDLAALLQVPVAVAEELKLQRGWASVDLCPDTRFELVSPSGHKVRELDDRQLAAIIEPRVEEILQLAAATIKRSGYAGLIPGGLVLTGGGSQLQGLLEVAADSLGLKARIGIPEGELLGKPEYATVAGLVAWGALLAESEAAATAEEQRRTGNRIKNWLTALFR